MANRYTGAHRDLENSTSARAYLTRELGEDGDLFLEFFRLQFVASPEEVRQWETKNLNRGAVQAAASPSRAQEMAFAQAVARSRIRPGAVKAARGLVRQARALRASLEVVAREVGWLEILVGRRAVNVLPIADTIVEHMLATFEPLFSKPKRASRANTAESETQKLAPVVAALAAAETPLTAKILAAAAVLTNANGTTPPKGQRAAARLCRVWENRLSRCRRALKVRQAVCARS